MKNVLLIVMVAVICANSQDKCDSLIQQINNIINQYSNNESLKAQPIKLIDTTASIKSAVNNILIDTIIDNSKYQKINKILSKSSGILLTVAGITGGILTIKDAEENGDFDYFGRKIGAWSKLHTCTLTLSIGFTLYGMITIACQ